MEATRLGAIRTSPRLVTREIRDGNSAGSLRIFRCFASAGGRRWCCLGGDHPATQGPEDRSSPRLSETWRQAGRRPADSVQSGRCHRKHALGVGHGRTFAEISEEWMQATRDGDTARAEELAGTRQMVMQANFLRASLFTSVLAYGVSALTVGVGVLTA